MCKHTHNTIKAIQNTRSIWTLWTHKKEQWIQNFALEYDKHFLEFCKLQFVYSLCKIHTGVSNASEL